MLTLRQHIQNHNELELALLDSQGELTPEIESMLAIKDINLPEKVDGYAYRQDFLDDRIEYLANKIKQIQQVKKTYESALKRTKDNIKFAMTEMNTNSLIGNEFTFKIYNSSQILVIDDPSLIPDEYKITTISIDPDKVKIKDALKESEIPGARLEQGQTLRKVLTK